MTENVRLEVMKSRLEQLRREINVSLKLAAPKRVEALRLLEERYYVNGERSKELSDSIFEFPLVP